MRCNYRYIFAAVCLMFCFAFIWGCQDDKNDSEKNTAKEKETSGQVKEYSLNDFVMDTVLAETIYGDKDVTKEIKEQLSKLETEQLSWREDESRTAYINTECQKGEKVFMEEDFASWVQTSVDLAKKSEGAFDPTIGRLTRLWNIEGENPTVPPQNEIDAVLKNVGYGYINIEETAAKNQNSEEKGAKEKYISMEKETTLDLGAVGKGIGCDAVKNYIEEKENVSGAVIAIGGSILVWGQKPDGENWKVAIRDPEGEDGTYMGVISLADTAFISTSGDYEKYFEKDGIRYHHILDPKTGYPSQSGLSSVTVVCGENEKTGKNAGLLSDGLSTACFVLGKDKGLKLLKEYDAEGVFIDKEGNVSVTEGLKGRFELLKEDYKPLP